MAGETLTFAPPAGTVDAGGTVALDQNALNTPSPRLAAVNYQMPPPEPVATGVPPVIADNGQMRELDPNAIATPSAKLAALNTPAPAPASVATQPVQAAPASMDSVRTTTELGKKLSPATKTATEGAFDAEARAVEAKARADEAAAENQARVMGHRNAELAALQERQDADRAAQQAETAKRVEAWDAAVSDYRANATIDPDRYKKRLGTGGRIANTIAIALGSFGAALARTPNYALQIIDEEISRDIRAQESEIAQKKGDVDMAQNAVAFFRQKGLDLQSAQMAAKGATLDRYQGMIEAEAAKSRSPQAKAASAAMLAGIEAKRAGWRAQVELEAQGRTVIERTKQPVGQVRSLSDELKLRELGVQVPQPDGKVKTYYAPTGDDAKTVRNAITVAKSLKANLAKMKYLVENGRQSLSPSLRKEVETLNDDIRTQFGVMRGLGALSDKDYRIASQLGDPESIWQRDSTTIKLIGQLHDTIDSGLMAQYEGRGLLQSNLVGQ